MAKLQQRRTQNTEGDFYVDASCIDCDTCRWMAPTVFHEAGDQSAVYHQPNTAEERVKALQALLACPTASIGTVEKPIDIQTVQQSFPVCIDENVYHCGYHAESSYGAASYLILRSEGNVLVDSPRFAPPLVRRLEDLGGIKYLYLTHRDDVADHQKFHDHFGAERILHEDDIVADTRSVEIKLSGYEAFSLAPDLVILPIPGHSKGHTALMYREKFLFSGDHLAWSERLSQLIAFRNVCWYSWSEQIRSMRRLSNYPFEWVLPGHGRRHHGNRQEMTQQMQQCIDWMERSSDSGW
ncbi:MAG: MBL fold metallo-hydrolase [Anaerolineae bacterium]|nr:MBL fold metallo-hydrolase [Gloeobacterales cyanobacterium ES-bin-313]